MQQDAKSSARESEQLFRSIFENAQLGISFTQYRWPHSIL